MNRLLLITLAVAALILGSQFVKACDPYDYYGNCYGDYSYDTYGRPSDQHSEDKPQSVDEIMSNWNESQREIQRDSDRQLQNLYEEGRHQAVMRELQQINESLNR